MKCSDRARGSAVKRKVLQGSAVKEQGDVQCREVQWSEWKGLLGNAVKEQGGVQCREMILR